MHASGSLYSIHLEPKTNTHGTDMKSTQFGIQAVALPPGAELTSLYQPNHSQSAEHGQEKKWGGFLCSIIVEIIADQ